MPTEFFVPASSYIAGRLSAVSTGARITVTCLSNGRYRCTAGSLRHTYTYDSTWFANDIQRFLTNGTWVSAVDADLQVTPGL